jgi:histidine triad (HIT) family protein
MGINRISNCIFCKIAAKEIKSDIIKETKNFIVIKDVNPVSPIHLLIISKKHYRSIMEIDDEFNGNEVFQIIKELAKDFKVDAGGFRTVMNTNNDGGQTVMHLHIHFMAERGFGWPPG